MSSIKVEPREDSLGEWRRTKYTAEVTPLLEGKTVTLFGWVAGIRRHGGIIFIIMYDKEGSIQLTVRQDLASEALVNALDDVSDHSSIGIRGVVKKMDKAPNGVEIQPIEMKVLAVARKSPPFQLQGTKIPRIDKLLDIRALALRRPEARAILKVRRMTLIKVREFFQKRGYEEVNTPKIIATSTEGGSALFPLLYYDKEAFLTQSPQLFKEQLVLSLEKVFEIANAYRAERSRTLHHLSEFLSLDVEEAFVDYRDIIRTLEDLMREIRSHIHLTCGKELSFLGLKDKGPIQEIPELAYDKAIEIVKSHDSEIEWGDDFSSESLGILGKEFPSFYFITDWPAKGKPFYIQSKGELTESFDLMSGPLEIASGGTRVSSKNELETKLREKGLNPNSFEYHLKVFDYGMPPHAGFGLGVERLLMILANQSNVRDVTIFPRDQYRLTP